MLVGIPKEIKNHEYRCAITPASVAEFASNGHQVLVQSNAGLENATLPFALEIANKGYLKALQDNKHLACGVNVLNGKITHKAVADSLGYHYFNLNEFL